MTKIEYFACHALFLLVSAALFPGLAHGDDAEWYFSRFTWENDDIFPQPVSEPDDRFYTNGMRFSWSKFQGSRIDDPLENLPRWASWGGRRICKRLIGTKQCSYRATYSFGQNFYTPEVIADPAPQPNDRPWAGWLYGSAELDVSPEEDSLHQLELQFGVTGPASRADYVQIEWHRHIDATPPQGWNNQFRSEIGANLFYDYYKKLGPNGKSRIDYDFVPNLRIAAGTLMTNVAFGGVARIGKNISGFLGKRIESAQPSSAGEIPGGGAPIYTLDLAARPVWEYYLFAGGYAKAVAHNYFLEGSLFHDDPGVIPERFVWDFLYGVSVRWNEWRLTYTISRRGPEFERSAGTDNGIHNFASVTLSREMWR